MISRYYSISNGYDNDNGIQKVSFQGGNNLTFGDTVYFKHKDTGYIISSDFVDASMIFSSSYAFSLKTYLEQINWDGELEYTTDSTITAVWYSWDGTEIFSSYDSDSDKQILRLRGIGNTYLSTGGDSTNAPCRWVINGSSVSLDGDLDALLDYSTVAKGDTPEMASNCFYGLFCGCSALISGPVYLPSCGSDHCFAYMFKDCINLQKTANLDSSISIGCYMGLYQGCTSLTDLNTTLQALRLADDCYNHMFSGCISLQSTPHINATAVAPFCCASMFSGCTSLTTINNMPNTSQNYLADYCYAHMFEGCTSLQTPPALPSWNLKNYCYASMFKGCTSLNALPRLSSAGYSGITHCYDSMFEGCTNIKLSTTQDDTYVNEYTIPYGAVVSGTITFTDMFKNTGGSFAGSAIANTTYYTPNNIITS